MRAPSFLGARVLIFDIETHGSELLWDMPPEEFFRIGGYAWNSEPVVLTTDLDHLREQIRSADIVIGHNIHAFDLTAVFGKDSTEPLEMAREGKIFDTWTHATLVMPAPYGFTDRKGRYYKTNTPEKAKRWFSLDNVAYQLGVEGKSHDLKALAKEHGGFGAIPTSDERFQEYLSGDVEASRAVARALLVKMPYEGYAVREQINAAIDAQNSRNGWRLDVTRAQARVDELDAERDRYMQVLVDQFGLPTEGKQPLRSKKGKEAVFKALESVGITPDMLDRTATGNPSLGGESILKAAEGKGDTAELLATNIAAIGGMRPLAESALKNMKSDGRVHVQIFTLQRSGRKSTQDPGLTVWTSRGKGSIEKAYYIPNEDDHVLVELDYSQADARIVAAYSGDDVFAERFAPGSDMHMITARLIWGQSTVDTDRAYYRQEAKQVTHASAYGAGAKKLAAVTGRGEDEMQAYNRNYAAEYPKVMDWRKRVVKQAERDGYVVNAWGRRMPVDEGREYTQTPALYGQSGTREIVVDALIRMPNEILCLLVAQVHDALVFSIPKDRADEIVQTIKECMECYWGPPDGSGQVVHFPVGIGPYATNWKEASH